MAINGITASVLATKYNRGDAADVQKYIDSEGITQADVMKYFPDFNLSTLKGITVPAAAATTNAAATNTASAATTTGSGLTGDIAKELMYRSSAGGGATTAEFDKYGGFNAVNAAAGAAGYAPTPTWIAGYEKSKGMAPSQYTLTNIDAFNYGGIAYNKGPEYGSYGGAVPLNLAGLQNQTNTQIGDLTSKYDKQIGGLNSQYGLLNTQYGTLNTSYQDLLKQFAALKSKSNSSASATNLATNSGVVSTGATNTSGLGGTPGTSSTGAVYGPDGTAYPSPAAAIAAGVYNYTMFPPTGAGLPKGVMTNTISAADTKALSGVTGNYFGGTNQNPDNPWVNLYPTKA